MKLLHLHTYPPWELTYPIQKAGKWVSFPIGARQNCAQCRWLWEWPTRQYREMGDLRNDGVVSSFVLRSHWDVYIPKMINLCFSGLQTWVSGFQAIFVHPSWTERLPKPKPTDNFLENAPSVEVDRPAFNGELLHHRVWETTNLLYKCTMWKARAVTLCRC